MSVSTANNKAEPFELIKQLGIGGFAHTYKARVLDQEYVEDFGTEIVALKIPFKEKERTIRRELEMNAALYHRLGTLSSVNIVQYLGFAIFRGQIVLALEYVQQGSLRDLIGPIGRQKRLPMAEAVKIAEGILAGLSVIHSEQVFHRDIKPENILMQRGTPKIADLGIARMLKTNELASTATGSLFYMSPESFGKQGASFTSDIWSAGLTLYEMVTGRLAFGEADTPVGVLIDMIRQEDHPSAIDVCPDIPVELSRIIDRSLCKDKAGRYASASEMLEALQQFRSARDDSIIGEIKKIREMISNMGNTRAIHAKVEEILDRYPRDTRAYQLAGEFYNQCQKYSEAIKIFKKGLGVDSSDALLRWDLGLAYQQINKTASAIQCLKKALASGLDPSRQRHAKILLKILREKKK